MAINEHVRLIIEVEGAQIATRQVRELAAEVRKLRAQATGAGSDFERFRKAILEEVRALTRDMESEANRFRKEAEKLSVPENLAAKTRARMAEVRDAIQSARMTGGPIDERAVRETEERVNAIKALLGELAEATRRVEEADASYIEALQSHGQLSVQGRDAWLQQAEAANELIAAQKKVAEALQGEVGVWANLREAIEAAHAARRDMDAIKARPLGAPMDHEEWSQAARAIEEAGKKLVAAQADVDAALAQGTAGLEASVVRLAQAGDKASKIDFIQQETTVRLAERVDEIKALFADLSNATQEAYEASQRVDEAADTHGVPSAEHRAALAEWKKRNEEVTESQKKLAQGLEGEAGVWGELAVAIKKAHAAEQAREAAFKNRKATQEELAAASDDWLGAEADLGKALAATREALEGNTADLEKNIRAKVEAAAATRKAAEEEVKAQKAVGNARKGASQQQRGVLTEEQAHQEVRKRGNLLLIDSGRLIQDLAYGWRAAVNNLDPLILNSERYSKAVQEANAGTSLWAANLKGLVSVLKSPAGLFLLVNALFTLSMVLPIFDKLGLSMRRFATEIINSNRSVQQLRKSIREAAKEAGELDRDMTLEDAQMAFGQLNNEINRLGNRQLWNRIRQGALELTPIVKLVSLFSSDLSDWITGEVEEVSKQLENLKLNRDLYAEVLKDFAVLAEVVLRGDQRVIAQHQAELIRTIERSGQQVIEARRRAGQENVKVDIALARDRSRLHLEELHREKRHVEALLRDQVSHHVEQAERMAEAVSTREKQMYAERIANFEAFIAIIQRRLAQIDDQVDQEPGRLAAEEREMLWQAAMRARALARVVEDAQRAATEAAIRAEHDRVEETIRLLQHEAEERIIQIRRTAEDYRGSARQRAALAEANAREIEAIERDTAENVQRAWAAYYANRQALQERLNRATEDFEVAQGADLIAALQARIQRAKDYHAVQLAILEGTDQEEAARVAVMEAERALAEEQYRRSAAFQKAIFQENRAVRNYSRQIRQLQEDIQAAFRPAAGPLVLGDERQLAVLRERLAYYQEEQDAARRALEAVIEQNKARQSLNDEQIREWREAQEALRSASLDTLRAQADIAREERRIYDDRVRTVQRWSDAVVDSLRDALMAQRQYTQLDIEYQRFRHRQEEQDIQDSYRRRQISAEEYNLRRRQLAQDRAQHEKDVERDQANFVERVIRSLTDMVIEEGARQLSAFIARTLVQIAFGRLAAKTSERIVGQAMLSIASSAGPAAGAVSIATLGAAAATGTAAAISGIAAVQAAAVSMTTAKGFAEGGYTGRGRKHDVAGVVHRDEYVMTKQAVRGQAAPFDALLDALERGLLQPGDIAVWVREAVGGASGTTRKAMPRVRKHMTVGDAFRVAGLPGYAEGGMVNALATVPSYDADLSLLAKEQKRTADSIEKLAEALESRPVEAFLHVDRRTQRDLAEGGRSYDGERRIQNPYKR
jgi:hypothetical protein